MIEKQPAIMPIVVLPNAAEVSMSPVNATLRGVHLRLWTLLFVIPLLFLSMALVMMIGGCGQLTQFRITNATGKEVAVTSGHTKKTVHILNGKTAHVPHTSGDITVTLPDGKTWVYRNLSPLDLKGTPFMAEKHYVFFGFQDGYVFRGSWTVDLLLSKDGRLYVVLPDAKSVDVEELNEPKGFPVNLIKGRRRRMEKDNPLSKRRTRGSPTETNHSHGKKCQA
jgi:hypothetical protein